MTDYCEKSDLPADRCAHCRNLLDDDSEVRGSAVNIVFRARFEGVCRECSEDIEVGQWITRDEELRYIHVGCR